VDQKNKESTAKGKQDPRVGSTKAIDLDKYKNKQVSKASAPRPAKKKYFSPQQELDAIEQDGRLEHLLEKQENNKLSTDEQAYLDMTLARHRQLCDLLGIALDDEDPSEQNQDELDPFARLDAIKLDDFKDD
jgi:ribosome assembly protein YihI (activator of Der GTPase)